MTTATATNPMIPTEALQSRGGDPLCWKFTANGEWQKVPAPWHQGKAGRWFLDHHDRLVFTTRIANDADEAKPALEVYEVRGMDASDPDTTFVAVFESMQHDTQGERPAVDTYFLVEPLAIAKLVNEFTTLLTVHPMRVSVGSYKVHKPEKRRRPKYSLIYS